MFISEVFLFGYFYYIPGGFARVASPKIISDCHMLRMNVCDTGTHAETRKRFDIYKSVGCLSLCLSLSLFLSLYFFLSLSFSLALLPPPPPFPLLTRGAE